MQKKDLKYINIDNEYLEKHGSGLEDFSSIIVRAINHEAENNPECRGIGFEHKNLFCDENWYKKQFEKIAQQKDYLDYHTKNSSLEEVQMAFWSEKGRNIKEIWSKIPSINKI